MKKNASWITVGYLFVGVGFITGGLWLTWPPLAFVWLGVFLIAMAYATTLVDKEES